MTNDLENINSDVITNVVKAYDQICKSVEFAYPSSIRIRIYKHYEGKLTLPSSLSVDIVEVCENNQCCINVKS